MATDTDIFSDFESQSLTDLPVHGLARYLRDESTRASMYTFRLPGEAQTRLWMKGDPIDALVPVAQHIERGGLMWAHNAQFDQNIWNEILRRVFPNLPIWRIEQTRCTAARARYNGLPGALGRACEAMGLPVQKDIEGKAQMLEIAANPDWTPQSHPDEFARMARYGIIDTDAMIGLHAATLPLPAQQQRLFEMDMRINERGFPVDVAAAQAMEDLRELALELIDYQITVLTEGRILAASEIAKLKDYASTLGEEIDDAGREALKRIAARDDVPDELKALVALRLDASRAPKKAAAILRAHVDNRMKFSLMFHGALSGRWTAQGCGGIQAHNFARPRPGKSAEACAEMLDMARRHDLAALAEKHGPVLAALADAQRALVRAEG